MSPDASGAPPLRIAILGAGWVSRTVWRPLLEAHPAFEVAAVVDTDQAAARKVAAGGREVPALSRTAELADLELDAAVIALPNHLHVPAACELLDRGVPVFVEKPVCRTLAEARTLAAAALEGGAVHAWSAARHRGDVRALAGLLPRLGEVRALGLNWTRASGVPQRDGWFVDRGLAGGGSLLDLGWHLLDVGLDLLGWPQVTRALGTLSLDWMGRAEATSDWRAQADDAGPGAVRAALVEDTARGFLLTDTGVAVSLESRWASHHALDSTTFTVEGTEGVAVLRCTFGFSPHRVDRSSLTLLRHGEETGVPLPEEPVGVEYERQVAELAARLTGTRAEGTPTRADSLAEITSLASCVDRLYQAARGPGPAVPAPSLETTRPRLRSL
ncbi:Gfo/Idh/MocA family protein [Streptomyces sp. NPDC001812]|uniref:Gfo/Idh/MocA family oxidoreductase n=1 Tax=Streptomyces cathayae TaxID=3031124 RepID=A0ABY8K012_9ACTN|nr:Gfo/Idh/MocA family oxidoreductase [Streptomyces sp. HUAS 5]WGD40983.1 Gfo/Idh/MocA family oxidoreductase [Streptomyces sp. HUAS 5]